MNKSEFLKELKSRCDTDVASMAALAKILEAGQAIIADALAEGDNVVFSGFGTFSTGERAERKGTNPRTGEALMIPASVTVKFKPGKSLKDAVK